MASRSFGPPVGHCQDCRFWERRWKYTRVDGSTFHDGECTNEQAKECTGWEGYSGGDFYPCEHFGCVFFEPRVTDG